MKTDFAVFARDTPEVVLVVEIRASDLRGQELEQAVNQLAGSMWQANCHYGLVVTPGQTYVLRDDFRSSGPQSIHVTHVLSTRSLLGELPPGTPEGGNLQEWHLQYLTEEWLKRLTTAYEHALGDAPEVTRAFFPEIVGAVAEGRVVAEAAV